MLKKLQIQNFALIDELNIEFKQGLSIITGETGAGKSILLGALNLITGQRADTKVLRDLTKKCIVEATFDTTKFELEPFFIKHDLDADELTLIRREINSSGKSRAFINDTPVKLSELKELGSKLLDIHSQHETLSLNDIAFQYKVLDTYSSNTTSFSKYSGLYHNLIKERTTLKALMEQLVAAKKDRDFINFQLNELIEANVSEAADSLLESEAMILEHAEGVKSALYRASSLLDNDGNSTSHLLKIAASILAEYESVDVTINELKSRLQSAEIEVSDILSELEQLKDRFEFDPERAEIVTERLDLLNSLKFKHGVNSISQLIVISNVLEAKLLDFENIEEEIFKKQATIIEIEKMALKEAQALSKDRKKTAVKLAEEIKVSLAELGMPSVEFCSKLEDENILNQYGINSLAFLFNANKGGDLQPIDQVASGGELSRLMLCFKSLISDKIELSTMIFDEIDTGVSGEIADKVGNQMRLMAEKMQVISITHLPQIAGKGHVHFKVYKEDAHGVTRSNIKELSPKERVDELAKMLSGATLTDAAIKNAKELLTIKK